MNRRGPITEPSFLGVILRLTLAGPLIAFSGCARQGAPSGGPPDTTPPSALSTIPASGTVNATAVAAFTIEFSEPVERGTLEPNLSVSPPLTGTPEIEWTDGGRRAVLHWADTLRTDATYRITIGIKTRDRHNNPFAEPFTFAFSTGAEIDRGEVRGRVHLERDEKDPATILLFSTEHQADTFWLEPPDYITQSGEKGVFVLPYLKEGAYRLLCLIDRNRNRRLDSGERLGMPVNEVLAREEGVADTIPIFMWDYDTTAFELTGCSSAPEGGFTVAFSHTIDTANWSSVLITVSDSVTSEPIAVGWLRPLPRRPRVVTILGDSLVAEHVYEIEVRGLHDAAGQALDSSAVCYTVYHPPTDVVGPRIDLVTLPDGKTAVSPRDPVVLLFTEPVDTTRLSGSITVTDSADTAILADIHWLDPRILTVTPHSAWPETTVVTVAIDSSRSTDRRGNPAPSQPFSWTFTPLAESMMGTVEGKFDVGRADWSGAPCRIEVHGARDDRLYRNTVLAPGTFAFDLPRGEWILGAYLDLDANGRWTVGSLSPFTPPEPRTVLSDTLSIRARFTVEDVLIRF